PEGIKKKNFLAITYLHELIKLYRLAEENIISFLIGLEKKGYRNVLVYGAGEVAITILGVVKRRTDRPLKVLALVDDDKERQERFLMGYNIISREEIGDYKHDGIVIASYAFEDDIISRLKEIGYPEDKIESFFTE